MLIFEVTEREVRRAMTSSHHHCLAYIRRIDDVNLTDVRAARNFVDMTTQNDVDSEAERLLSELRDNVMSTWNARQFSVQWQSPDGLNIISHDHYLNSLCSDFYS